MQGYIAQKGGRIWGLMCWRLWEDWCLNEDYQLHRMGFISCSFCLVCICDMAIRYRSIGCGGRSIYLDYGIFLSYNERTDRMKAWQLLDSREKWCQGKMRDSCGRYCLMGAIYAAYPVKSDYREKRIMVHKHLNRTPSKWNDDDERTWEIGR